MLKLTPIAYGRWLVPGCMRTHSQSHPCKSVADILAFFLIVGCKVESFFLNIEAVNTHRERPVVSFHKHTFLMIDAYYYVICI